MPSHTPYRSKTVAAWLTLALGALGLHRLYLYGRRDRVVWAYPLPTLLGLVGVQRLLALGQDDMLAWLLIPLLGLMLSLASLTAIVYALTSDEKWDARHNPDQPVHATGWGPVLAAILALLLGGAAFMSTVAYGGLRFFEWQMAKPVARSQASGSMG